VSLAPLKSRTFVLACILNFVIGFGLYSATYLMPVYLSAVRGYSSMDIGATVFVTGGFMFFGAPIAARLSGSVDPRKIIAVGFSLFALGLWLLTDITPQWGFWELFAPQAVRGFALLLCIVPAVGLSLATVPLPMMKAASGLFNLMRNLGGAVGIALVNTWLQDFARLHALRIGEAMGVTDSAARDVAAQLGAMIAMRVPDPNLAAVMAAGEMRRVISPIAFSQAFQDVFTLMAAFYVLSLLLVPFCRMPPLLAQRPTPDAH
jgi:DHA2 family multidrug resistance protein